MALFPNTRTLTVVRDGSWRIDGYPLSGPVSAEFGSVDEAHQYPHAGVDIAAAAGTPVCAPCDGVVRDVFIDVLRGTPWDSFKAIFGNAVILEHGGYVSLYAHLRDAPPLMEGQMVAAGTVIGHVGSTGQSTGPHLHWGLAPALFNGQPSYLPRVDCLNPLAYAASASPAEPLPNGEFLPEQEPLRPPFSFWQDPLAARWAQEIEGKLK